jgi:cytochrome c oxidase subunit III
MASVEGPRAVVTHADHFASAAHEQQAAQLGMWLFLVSELLLFGGMFTAYAVFRTFFPQAFIEGSRHLDVLLGTVNTVVLLTSSFTVASAVHFARESKGRAAGVMLGLSLLLALVFLVLKGSEYLHHFHTRALPGRYYALEGLTLHGASMFFTLYFFATGLHAIHVLIGMAVLGWLTVGAFQGRFHSRRYVPVELGGMYWHLVDLVWIFLYPLLYLV